MGVKVITFGCRLNQYDSEWLKEGFELAGYNRLSGSGNRLSEEVCIINTCAVTAHACREARNAIRTEALRVPKPFIIVTGCYVKLWSNELSQIAGIDLMESDLHKIVKDFLKVPLLTGIKRFNHRDKAFIKVQEGCDQFCSYCVVPYARGNPQDRSLNEILTEVRNLIETGYEEFILTGTNLGLCHNLLEVLKSLVVLEGVRRIGLGSIEPVGISDELLDFIYRSGKCSRYFHIPLQSGDNKVLKLMGRWYNRDEYLDLICRIKDRLPDSAIGADVIVGFPGEGENEFLNTYNLIKDASISRLHVFRYSGRPGTPAFSLTAEPTDSIKKHRSALLRQLSETKWEAFRAQFIGKILESHIEGMNLRNSACQQGNGLAVGVTNNYIKVLFNSNDKINKGFVDLRINAVNGVLTYGEVVCSNEKL
ncbi:MAG: MiaB/RimO family radical SAM methylthiotransferase [Candidatus Stahlbacteria bacterium]|nr:MiaB/RimO family radical SAM methylthiotransferase [Candidatus Stahlbacteria bacterium]